MLEQDVQMFVYFCGISGCCTEIDSSHQPITITTSILQDLQLTVFLRGTAKMTRHLAASTEAQRCLPRALKHLENLENEDKQENTQPGITRRHVVDKRQRGACGAPATEECARQYHHEKLVEGDIVGLLFSAHCCFYLLNAVEPDAMEAT